MKYIITSGPMETQIDSVRKIENSSSGRLGSEFVSQLLTKGIEVVYIHTPAAVVPQGDFKQIVVTNHQQLLNALKQELTDDSIVIHAMAISDFEFKGSITYSQMYQLISNNSFKNQHQFQQLVEEHLSKVDKLSSSSDQMLIMNRAIKIIDQIKQINPQARLVGFKLLSNVSNDQLIEVANGIRNRANCEYVVANLKEQVSTDQHIATIVGANKTYQVKSKQQIAKKIIELMEE